MRVFVAGASGTIGSTLVRELLAHGHVPLLGVRDVDAAARRWQGLDAVRLDLADLDGGALRAALAGVDVVINTVGIFREHASQTFDALHVKGALALFDAAYDAGVRHVIQLSALGARADAAPPYLRSKAQADAALQEMPLRSTIVQPSLVFAPGGASTRWFLLLASLPVTPLPGRGLARVQPLHLEDLCEALVRLVGNETAPPRLEAVGPASVTLRDYLAALKRSLRLPTRFVSVPRAMVRMAAIPLSRLPGSLVTPDALRMLEAGNTGDVRGIVAVLDRAPRPPSDFIDPADVGNLRRRARLAWLLPVLRLSIAAMWIVTGLVSMFAFPVAHSMELLARTGLHGDVATVALYGAAVLDIALGVGMLVVSGRRRRWIYRAQLALILLYTAAISLRLPEFWAHPYGPVLKNLPLLAAILVLHELDDGDGPDHG